MSNPILFSLRLQYGRRRYFPLSDAARAIVDVTGRKCLNEGEIERLRVGGLSVSVSEGEGESDSIFPNVRFKLGGE